MRPRLNLAESSTSRSIEGAGLDEFTNVEVRLCVLLGPCGAKQAVQVMTIA